MAVNRAQVGFPAGAATVLLFDGVCGLCNGFVQFVLPRDRARRFRFAPLQGVLGNRVQPDAIFTTLYVLADYDTAVERQLTKARAVLFVLNALGWPWKALGAFRVLPTW